MTPDRHSTVISLGGSLIARPSGIAVSFLKQFKTTVENLVDCGRQVFIITGGGQTARDYMQALDEFAIDDPDKIDRMGIAATRLNAHLLDAIFGGGSAVGVATNPEVIAKKDGSVVVAAPGDTPGHSSDFQAVKVAEATGSEQVVNLSNIDHVYDKDPKEHEDATALAELSWDEYLEVIPGEWTPGLHSPFDPVAAQAGKKAGVTVGILSGENINQIQPFLAGDDFVGTRIYAD
jgi:uridylate kinase